jgi:D-serine deaminase-like pyridoxal phosphate-dependent protein
LRSFPIAKVNTMLSSPYPLPEMPDLLTPALLIDADRVDQNIQATIGLLGGDPRRWRPHVKTAKLAWAMQRMLDYGVRQFKCATTLELATLCALGADDVLLAYPVVGAGAQRVRELAAHYPDTTISVLVERQAHLAAWAGSAVRVFVDLDPGMHRTGVDPADLAGLVALIRAAQQAGIVVGGLHWYDGHYGGLDLPARTEAAHAGYDQLMALVAALAQQQIVIPELITAGTPSLPCAASYAPFANGSIRHCASPGTVLYNDTTSITQLPSEAGFTVAAFVVCSVVSQPQPGRITCDAGHKAVSADAGVPTCAVLGHVDWEPQRPSEEHLPIDLPPAALPPIGTRLVLVPRHVCPTVNNFDQAVIVRAGQVVGIEGVTARGHEGPLLGSIATK